MLWSNVRCIKHCKPSQLRHTAARKLRQSIGHSPSAAAASPESPAKQPRCTLHINSNVQRDAAEQLVRVLCMLTRVLAPRGAHQYPLLRVMIN